jgi:hypothetical protein
MSVVLYTLGKPRKVLNLGWLLKHARWAVEVNVVKHRDGSATLQVDLDTRHIKNLHVGRGSAYRYVTDFADYSICLEWIDRPVFRGLDLFKWECNCIHSNAGCPSRDHIDRVSTGG